MKETIQPLGDRVLIEPNAPETIIGSVIHVPESAKQKPQRGKIIAVGEGVKTTRCDVGAGTKYLEDIPILKSGQTVMFQKHRGVAIAINGKDYLLMRESQVEAIIHEEEFIEGPTKL